MRTLLTTMLLFGITMPLYGQDLKPGTPEWDRHFSELRKKGEKLSRETSRSSSSASASSKLKSGSPSKKRPDDARLKEEMKRAAEAARIEREKDEINAMPAKYRQAYAEALHPDAFDAEHAPSVEATVKHLQSVVAKATQLDDVIPYLSAPFRQRYLQLLAGKDYGSRQHTPDEDLAYYKSFFDSIASYDSSVGSSNKDIAYGYVWTKGSTSVLYQLEFVGEGRRWQFNGWKAQLSRR